MRKHSSELMLPYNTVFKNSYLKPTDILTDCPPQVICSKSNESEHRKITLYLKYTERIMHTSPNPICEHTQLHVNHNHETVNRTETSGL